jgi:hypothetical protein
MAFEATFLSGVDPEEFGMNVALSRNPRRRALLSDE